MRLFRIRWMLFLGVAVALVISPSALANPASRVSNNTSKSKSLSLQQPIVPNPKIEIDGKLVPAPERSRNRDYQPAFLPRAVAPPTGDISISNTDSSPAPIELGTQERVRRLVLRDASVREVLSMLGRLANLDIVFVKTSASTRTSENSSANDIEQIRTSLDIKDKPLQQVFNQILRATGLQAYREGDTIFVGIKLPNEARNLISRSLRLNQVTAAAALNYLVALGAESAISRDRVITNIQAVPVGGGTPTPATQTQTSTETRVETQRVDFQDGTPLLRSLQVVGDERTNSVTLIGSPKQIEIASAHLARIDSRRRQVAVNVKILDINLLATQDINTSFSFGIGDTSVQNDRGNAIVNFGTRNPVSERDIGATANFAKQFLSRLQAQIVSGNAKVLTDPTLIVQEGQQASVNLTQEVVGNIERNITDTVGGSREIVTVKKENVGLTLGVKVERIDDNGFVSLSVAPVVKAPQAPQQTPNGQIFLVSERSLNSGLIRLRDNQTLILSGIIQDADRTTVTKVPILGDIPILGALFRSTNNVNQRQEVIVLLTPKIMDDSERSSSMGFNYNPSPEARQMLERRRK
ncbi:type II and III secretion system protein [Cyanosarcina cf. burmensis CCALA 770]|jgi:type IV pilus assembly protein PilQ|nr:type II and III secretion system protein [Cyanosarcina cf. burmensis CCALA 770]